MHREQKTEREFKDARIKEADKELCKKCGHTVSKHWNYCTRCGHALK